MLELTVPRLADDRSNPKQTAKKENEGVRENDDPAGIGLIE